MTMKLRTLALALLFALCYITTIAQTDNSSVGDDVKSSKKEIVKTGYNFGPLPAVAFDADKGFQLGALLNIYDFGDGTVYPNTRQQWYFEASFFTKGSQLFVVSYDNKFLARRAV